MKKRNLILALVPLLAAAVALLYSAPAYSYLPEIGNSFSIKAHWNSPPSWRINTSVGSNINVPGTNVTNIIAASFNSWKAAPNVSGTISGLTQGATTTITTHANDGVNLICFVCSSSDFGSGGDTLAITYTSFDTTSGQIVDADILFNQADNFDGGTATCSANASNCSDLQTVASHEIGHFLGLDHSAVTSAVMYPFAPDMQHNLSSDDVAGISNTYPSSAPTVQTGSISGQILNSSNAGVCGAHVFADSTTAAASYPSPVRKTPIGAYTNTDGTYTINGLPPDTYNVTAEPLDGPVDHTNIDTYTSTVCNASTLPTNFTTRQH
jgi:hypothetical protein